MMNILEIQDALKSMSNEQLIREIRMPSGSAPPFLVASEMDRRQNMRQRFAERQPQSTVIDDLTMQMNQGIGGMMPQPMPMNQPMGMPKSSPELMPARRMAAGGLASAISDAIAPVLAKAQADAVGGVTNTFVGDTSPMTDMASRIELGNRLRSGPSYPVTNFPITNPDTVMDRPRLGASPNPRPTAPIMGKGSNPNMAIPSLGATAFGRTPARGMVAGGLTALQRAAASNIGRATQGVGGPKGGLGTFFRNLFPSRGSIRSTGPIAGMAPPSLTLGDVARTALLTGPVGAATVLGLSGIDPLTAPLGDGTLAGAYGLTEDEFNQVLQYMQQEGLNFSTDSTEFADLAARLTGKNVPRLSQFQAKPGTGGLFSDVVTPKSREEEAIENQAKEQVEQIKKAQEEARNIFEERDKRRMQAGILGAGLETIIRGQKGEPLFQAVAEGLKSQALPAFKEQGEMQLAAQIKKNLQDAKIAAEAQGKVGDLVKLRASIAKQAGETVDPEAKASIVQTLEALDQFLFARFGISAGGGMGPQDLLSQVLAEQGKRSSVVKEATR